MKVTQQSEPKFIPVVITLETQEEVDILTSLVGAVAGVGKGRRWADSVYDQLFPLASEFGSRHSKYLEGLITSKSH